MKIDPYLCDTLMRDLTGHSRSAAAFLVYMQLYRQTHALDRTTAALSYAVLAAATGLSKRSVQTAVSHLLERRLISSNRKKPTSVPVYTVLTPWIRKRKQP